MKVLVYGAGNWITISILRYLYKTGHTAVVADTGPYFRAFYSRFCKKKYIFRDPLKDEGAFIDDLNDCIDFEGIEFLIPASDRALLDLLSVNGEIPRKVKLPYFPDREKINYVMNKKNIPSLSLRAGINLIPTFPIDQNLSFTEIEKVSPPYALKLQYGISGAGFKKVDSFKRLKQEIEKIRGQGLEEKYIIQKYINGPVYGAGGVFQNNRLKYYFSYKYLRRFPSPAGASTLCELDFSSSVKCAMSEVLKVLKWNGFCHMDFVIEDETQKPYLMDINPVHWYSMPYSLSGNLNCLQFYLGGGKGEDSVIDGLYVTLSMTREFERLLLDGIFFKGTKTGVDYWKSLRGLKRSDFFWDPLPVLLAPFLKLLRFAIRLCKT